VVAVTPPPRISPAVGPFNQGHFVCPGEVAGATIATIKQSL
jgi:hypothetical protein